jgi:two-component system chemotaxis response regulator CheY
MRENIVSHSRVVTNKKPKPPPRQLIITIDRRSFFHRRSPPKVEEFDFYRQFPDLQQQSAIEVKYCEIPVDTNKYLLDLREEALMSRTILLVEDTPMFQYVIGYQLRGAGFRAICAEHGEAALKMLETENPSLILLDMSMPVMDGLTFLKHLRQLDTHRATPVIMLSASSDVNLLEQARQLGVETFLVKSRFSLKELLAAIESTIGPNESSADEPAQVLAAVGAPKG